MWQLVWCATASCMPFPDELKDLPARLLYPTRQECQLAAEAERIKHRTAICLLKSDDATFPPVPGVWLGRWREGLRDHTQPVDHSAVLIGLRRKLS